MVEPSVAFKRDGAKLRGIVEKLPEMREYRNRGIA